MRVITLDFIVKDHVTAIQLHEYLTTRNQLIGIEDIFIISEDITGDDLYEDQIDDPGPP